LDDADPTVKEIPVSADPGAGSFGAPGAPPDPDVALIRWPDDAAVRVRLAAAGRPRLLLVSGGEPAPLILDDGEDWVRLPASEEELRIRIATVAARARARAAARPRVPLPDADGILRTELGWVALPPIEERLCARLAAEAGLVVRRADVATAAWPERPPTDPRALDGVVRRLRRRVAPLGLAIHTVAGRGFLLEAAPSR
jgi:hypothetical protein